MASCVRFLHCAGFRFGSPSWEGLEAWATLRNQDLWQTFEATIALCRSENVDFLFLVGNLFDQEYVSKETVERVASVLAKVEGTRIFIVPGETDPLIITSAYRLTVWPSNVHIFSGGISSVKLPAQNVIVYGAGWTAYRQEGSFLDGFRAKMDGTISLMLLHAEVSSEKNSERFSKILPEQIALSGLNYLALGHEGVWSGIQRAGETLWADCGSPEARSFHESGPHGVLLGEIENGSVQLEFRELGQRRYHEKVLSQSDMETFVAQLLAETSPQGRLNDLFRIKLMGTLHEEDGEVLLLRKQLADEFRYVQVVPFVGTMGSGIGVDVVLSRESVYIEKDGIPNVTQVFIAKLQECLAVAGSAKNHEHWELVQKIGLAALGQGRVDDED
ncbi:hypothetical protein [Desulfosporosinus sp. Sb-LF]|uniref:metallophosphoesterase family protein n=1 Tax=Desulfosporosinus sp. Sb-LF TaxID=2560027 RepID=UPI00107F537F|nr:hypothetical protein [Desulfosporosinus sp. Sb-LF]TGE31688.1 hypothetical protein E4K68_15860 [Desulfosporosinus sp. Sb-LF]